MSLNFGQFPPLTTELAALECLKNRCHHVISVDIDPIFFRLAGNKDMHIMNEFEFRPDQTNDYGVRCPWASKKYPYRPYIWENGVSTFSLLFLIGSFWYFHVTRTSIKAWMSLNFFKWDLSLAHWTQVSDHCPLGYLFLKPIMLKILWQTNCSQSAFIKGNICSISCLKQVYLRAIRQWLRSITLFLFWAQVSINKLWKFDTVTFKAVNY